MGMTIRGGVLAAALKDAWPLWLAIGGIALSVSTGRMFSKELSETVRYAGTALQVLGLATVAYGLSQTRQLFGRPSLRSNICGWFRKLAEAFVAPKPVSLQVSNGVIASVGLDAQLVRVAGEEASLEHRVSVLEKNLNQLRDELNANKKEFQQKIKTIRERIDSETQERRTEDEQTAKRIEELAVGGIHLEIVGLWWLFFGIVGTSIPDEIAAVLRLLICPLR
jgi:hypothetical protein